MIALFEFLKKILSLGIRKKKKNNCFFALTYSVQGRVGQLDFFFPDLYNAA